MAPGDVVPSLSPSIDIQVSSNFKRLIFDVCLGNAARVTNLMKALNEKGEFKLEKNELKKINLKLWEIEDGKRAAEKNKKFDEKFIELARNVYKFNDERAKIKLAINTTLGSNIKEVKSYE